MADLETCPDCGLTLPAGSGEVHPYLGASASCWALYGEVLAREYADPRYMKVHRLTVDAYAAQHPGKPERRSIQSVWVHLAGLYLTLERGLRPDFVRRVMESIIERSDTLSWLEPPVAYGSTVADVVVAGDADGHAELVRRWADDVWAAWRNHQGTVRTTVDRHLARL